MSSRDRQSHQVKLRASLHCMQGRAIGNRRIPGEGVPRRYRAAGCLRGARV